MDHMAAKINMDPVEFRIKNFLKDGDMTLHHDQLFKGHNPLADMIRDLGKSAKLEERKKFVKNFNQNNKWKKRGMSCIPVRYSVAGFSPMPFYCQISIYEGDGTIAVTHGGIEMGQGKGQIGQQWFDLFRVEILEF